MKPELIEEKDFKKVLEELPLWEIINKKLNRQFLFEDFIEAFSFLTKVAIHSERLNHHPEIFNVYNKVSIKLFTHDLNDLSTLDIKLAKTIDSIYDQVNNK